MNSTAINAKVAKYYGCRVEMNYTKDEVSVRYKARRVILDCNYAQARNKYTIAQWHAVCQQVSGRNIADYWTA